MRASMWQVRVRVDLVGGLGERVDAVALAVDADDAAVALVGGVDARPVALDHHAAHAALEARAQVEAPLLCQAHRCTVHSTAHGRTRYTSDESEEHAQAHAHTSHKGTTSECSE